METNQSHHDGGWWPVMLQALPLKMLNRKFSTVRPKFKFWKLYFLTD